MSADPARAAPPVAGVAPQPPVPASGAWREGDPLGGRHLVDVGPLDCEAGGRLPQVRLSWETWGQLNERRDNAVLVLHALTGDSHVTGPPGLGHPTPGWWDGLVGPGRALDTDRWCVVAPNVLGGCQGSTGPASPAPDGRPWGSRFPFLTVRDQVAAEALLADHLGIDAWALVLGGSMGGMRALEWAVTHPSRVERVLVLGACAAATADQIAWCAPQLAAIRSDPAWRGGDYYEAAGGDGPHAGLGVARRIAHTTYRSGAELEQRFGRAAQLGEQPFAGGRYAVESYLDHHADKLARRFDANSYLVLTEAMSSHDIGRDRGGAAAALSRVQARSEVLALSSDRLYPPEQSHAIAAALPGDRPATVVQTPFGHDGFLVETVAVGRSVRRLLAADAPAPRRTGGRVPSGDGDGDGERARSRRAGGRPVTCC